MENHKTIKRNVCKFFFILNINALFCLTSSLDDYCNNNVFCKFTFGPHIKCNNTGNFSDNCPENAELINLNEDARNHIVMRHNQYRNSVASGKLNGFKSAERMAKMSWSTELSELAELNVKTCEFKHDNCRNTKTFPFSGQNLATWMSYGEMNEKNSTLNFLLKMIDVWFSEFKYANMNYINKYELTKYPIGHFALIIAERNNCVGCAIIKYRKSAMYHFNVACNYAWNNILDFPIYKTGGIASKCKTGPDTKYSALCSVRETYSQNPSDE